MFQDPSFFQREQHQQQEHNKADIEMDMSDQSENKMSMSISSEPSSPAPSDSVCSSPSSSSTTSSSSSSSSPSSSSSSPRRSSSSSSTATATASQAPFVLTHKLQATLFGGLFVGFDTSNKRQLAVKVSALKNVMEHRTLRGNVVYESPFREAEIMKIVCPHPNIVDLCGVYQSNNHHYLATEFVPGGDLFALMSNQDYFSDCATRKLMKQVIGAIHHLHKNNIAHLDLSLENLLVVNAKRLHIKLCDFGVARIFSPDTLLPPSETFRIGKVAYMPPEIYLGQSVDAAKADIFSAGVIMFMLLTGSCPFENSGTDDLYYRMIASGHIDKLLSMAGLSDRVSKDARDVLTWMLQAKPSDRPSTRELAVHPWFYEPQPPSFSSSSSSSSSSVSASVPSSASAGNSVSLRSDDGHRHHSHHNQSQQQFHTSYSLLA